MKIQLAALFLAIALCACSHAQKLIGNVNNTITPGAERLSLYLPLLQNKRVAVFANQTSIVGKGHLVDTLMHSGVNIKVIYGPEHGFRGNASAGEKLGNYTDAQTGLPVVSLYGAKRKPSAEDLKDIDIVIFDIQDIGVRFYTYISSLEELMDACIVNNKPLIVLDRPNPNGFYVDGPVMEQAYRSFIGRQAVPIVYGMTIGEYGLMLAGEQWLSKEANERIATLTKDKKSKLDQLVKIIPCNGYTHTSKYTLPVKPSPNIPTIQTIYLYPSTCLFEGTALSEGRGTTQPFQVFGHPDLPKTLYSFTPQPNEGAKVSKHYGRVCYGWKIDGTPEAMLDSIQGRIQLRWLINAYNIFPNKDAFFTVPQGGKIEESSFNRLVGNNELWQQIRAGVSEDAIRQSWEPGLQAFRLIRKKYLLYKDF